MTRRERTDRGIAVLLVVLMVNALLTAVALSIDLGRLRVAERSVQRMADVASLDAARFLSTPTATPEELISVVKDAAIQSAERNQHVLAPADVSLGLQQDGDWHEAVPGTSAWPPTSVQVTGRATTQWLFLPGGRSVERIAVSEMEPVVGFWLGSGLASLAIEDSPLLSSVMAGLVGSADGRVELVNWQSLAAASVALDEVVLQATAAGIDDYLHAELAIEDHLDLIAQAIAPTGPASAVIGLRELALALRTNPLPPVSIGDLFDLATPTSDQALASRVGVLELAHGLLLLGHAGGPAVQIDLETDLGPIARTYLEARVTEPPQYAFGPVGTTASTAQVDLLLSVEVPLAAQIRESLDHLFAPPLGGLPVAVIDSVLADLGTLRMDVALDAAVAEATVIGVICPSAESDAVATFLVDSRLADVTVEVFGSQVAIPLSGPEQYPVSVSPPFGPGHTVTAPGPLPDLGVAASAAIPVVVATAAGPLLGGLSFLLTPLTNAIAGVIQPFTESIHQQVVLPTLAALGITTGTSYLTVDSVGCQTLRLIR